MIRSFGTSGLEVDRLKIISRPSSTYVCILHVQVSLD